MEVKSMLKGYRTVIFNVIMTGVMAIRLWNPEAEFPGPEEITQTINYVDLALTGVWGVGNAFFRAVTNTPIGSKK